MFKYLLRQFFIRLTIGSLVFLFTGCLSTLYPIFHKEDVIYNERLLGYWKYAEGNSKEIKYVEIKKIPAERLSELSEEIRQISDNGYLASYFDNKQEVKDQYFVFLTKIGANYFLDYYPAETENQKNADKYFKDHFIKMHNIYKYDIKDNDHFDIKRFDKDFLDKLISDNKINIRHEVKDGSNIITASTDELQKFIIQYSDNPAAFGENITRCSRIVDY